MNEGIKIYKKSYNENRTYNFLDGVLIYETVFLSIAYLIFISYHVPFLVDGQHGIYIYKIGFFTSNLKL